LTHNNTAFHQLLKPLSRHDFEGLAKKHHFGQKLRTASRWDQFIGMAMSQLSGRQSLRDIESNLQAQRAKLYHLGAKPLPKTTLARLNEKQPFELYQTLFYQLLKQLKSPSSAHKFKFKNPLFSLDSSQIDLSIKIFPWATVHKDKAAVKLHVGLNHANMIPEFVEISEGKQNDLIQGRQFDFKRGSIVAFDRAYVDYKWYKRLNDKGVFFVTRLRTSAHYHVTERRSVKQQTDVTSDQSIRMNHKDVIDQGIPKLRRVGFVDKETGKRYNFLTNNFALAATTIAAIYKDRWQVELFFKAIKQNLKIKAFVGNTKNAILTQIWIAMISYLLLAYARHIAKTGWTVQRIMRVIQLNLFERRNLKDILVPEPPPDKNSENQGCLDV